jgi:glycosyltransferase involved in cell wall biosynthesis
MDPDEIPGRRFNQVLHLDDPTFSNEERAQIRAWFLRLKKGDRKGMVVVTFKEAELYIRSIDSEIATCIIEQGYTELENRPEKFERFSFVYSSPYIDYKGDKHAHHPSWSAIHLLEDIIPYIIEKYKEVEIHLIGRLGENARSYVSKFENVVCHGLVCPRKNAFLLSKCHIALYPRVQDMKRRVLKVSEYMGAEIPVIAYRQEDTNLVSEFGTGLLAEDYLEFISNINLLYFDSALREQITARIKKAKEGRSWKELGKTLDKAIELHTSKYQF